MAVGGVGWMGAGGWVAAGGGLPAFCWGCPPAGCIGRLLARARGGLGASWTLWCMHWLAGWLCVLYFSFKGQMCSSSLGAGPERWGQCYGSTAALVAGIVSRFAPAVSRLPPPLPLPPSRPTLSSPHRIHQHPPAPPACPTPTCLAFIILIVFVCRAHPVSQVLAAETEVLSLRRQLATTESERDQLRREAEAVSREADGLNAKLAQQAHRGEGQGSAHAEDVVRLSNLLHELKVGLGIRSLSGHCCMSTSVQFEGAQGMWPWAPEQPAA